jgi:hypothetical protein
LCGTCCWYYCCCCRPWWWFPIGAATYLPYGQPDSKIEKRHVSGALLLPSIRAGPGPHLNQHTPCKPRAARSSSFVLEVSKPSMMYTAAATPFGAAGMTGCTGQVPDQGPALGQQLL